MALYETQAYNWSDQGYNATYNTSVTATFNDDDGAYQGANDTTESISIDGGDFSASTSEPYVVKIDFTTPDGETHVENFQCFQVDNTWYFAPGVDSDFTEGSTLGNYISHTDGWDYNSIVCFAGGTLIKTTRGPVPVEHLRPGDMILTLTGDPRPLRWSMVRRLGPIELARNPNLRPIRISSGSLGNGYPKRDLLVSRQHRMLIHSPIVQRMLSEPAALIAAHHLTQLAGVTVDTSINQIDYHHLLFAKHEIIFAESTPSESLYLGAQTRKTLPHKALEEIEELFGSWNSFLAAPCPAAPRQHKMVLRHKKNRLSLLTS